MEPSALTELGVTPAHRSFAGHVLSLGIHVFIFGALAYLTFLHQGGLAGTLLLIYVSAIPLAIAIDLIRVARAEQRIAAHHVIKGVMTGIVLCGLGGLYFLFPYQIAYGLVGAVAYVVVTRYLPAAQFLKPPTLHDLTGSTPFSPNQTTRTVLMLAGGLVLLAGGIALTGFAVVGELHHGFSFTYTSGG